MEKLILRRSITDKNILDLMRNFNDYLGPYQVIASALDKLNRANKIDEDIVEYLYIEFDGRISKTCVDKVPEADITKFMLAFAVQCDIKMEMVKKHLVKTNELSVDYIKKSNTVTLPRLYKVLKAVCENDENFIRINNNIHSEENPYAAFTYDKKYNELENNISIPFWEMLKQKLYNHSSININNKSPEYFTTLYLCAISTARLELLMNEDIAKYLVQTVIYPISTKAGVSFMIGIIDDWSILIMNKVLIQEYNMGEEQKDKYNRLEIKLIKKLREIGPDKIFDPLIETKLIISKAIF